MKKSLILLLSLLTFGLFAQNIPPQAINFQGVAIDKDGIPVPGMDELGNPIPNKAIRVRFSILAGGSQANASYVEEHLTNTDEYGRFNLAIGRGTASVGTFSNIQWGDTTHFLKVEIDLSGIGTNYSLTSIQEFLSVPYALYAKTSGSSNGNDNDPDPTNELQNLNINGTQLSISSGNSVQLPVSTDSQTLNINGNALSIANGNTVQLPVSTDSQTLSITGNTLSILNGNAVSLPVSLDNDTTNELQTLTLVGDTLKISNGNSVLIHPQNTNSQVAIKSPNDFCFYGGQFVDLGLLYQTYNTINLVAVGSKYIVAFCSNTGQTNPPSLIRINRQNSSFNTIATSLPNSGNFYRSTDSIIFFLSNNAVKWINFNNPTSQFLSSNNYNSLSGNALTDLKNNMLYFEASGLWYKFNFSNNIYQSISLPSGTKTLIGADSMLVGSLLINTNTMTNLSNWNLGTYSDPVVRIGSKIIYKNALHSGSYSRLRILDLPTNNSQDLTANCGYNQTLWTSSYVDPVYFNNIVINGKLLFEYAGLPFKRINNHIITSAGLTDLGNYSGTPYLSISRELLQIDTNGHVSTFWYGSTTTAGHNISRYGNYTVISLPESFGCHENQFKLTPGVIIYDAL